MDNNQIQSLAREYAEEIFKNDESNPDLSICLLNDIKFEAAADFEEKLRFLLRRYALVEKSTIKEAWSMITGVYLDHDHITYDGARYLFNEMLFPEIAKEVE